MTNVSLYWLVSFQPAGGAGPWLCGRSWAALFPEGCFQRFWREIWCSERPCWQGEKKTHHSRLSGHPKRFTSDRGWLASGNGLKWPLEELQVLFSHHVNLQHPLVSAVCHGLWVQRKGAAAYVSKRQVTCLTSDKKTSLRGVAAILFLFFYRLLQGVWREVWRGEGESRQSGSGLRLQGPDREASVTERWVCVLAAVI